MKRLLVGLCFFLMSTMVYASEQDQRVVESISRVKKNYSAKNWVFMIREAYQLYAWGEISALTKVLRMAGEVAVMRGSDAAALQVSALFQKIPDYIQSRYWLKTAEHLKARRMKRWKKY